LNIVARNLRFDISYRDGFLVFTGDADRKFDAVFVSNAPLAGKQTCP